MADFPSHQLRDSGTRIVQDYLDNLLSEAALELEVVERSTTPTAGEPNPMCESTPEPEHAAEREPASESASRTPADTHTNTCTARKPDTAISPAPEASLALWRSQSFTSLLFEVGGLQMAAPLQHLGGVSTLSEPLHGIAGQADWLLGLMRWNGRNLRVVDTARLLMPERLVVGATPRYEHLIVLGDSHWALAATDVSESLPLGPDDIRWHQGSVWRPWLGGMLVHRLCVLIDVGQLVQMLDRMGAPHTAHGASA